MFYTINEFRHSVFPEVYNVYEVFQNYFGEAFVDLQNLPSDDEIAQAFLDAQITMREDGSGYVGTDEKFSSVTSNIIDNPDIKPFILIHWPMVRITNENDKSIVIHDLYAQIVLNTRGNIPTEYTGFLLNRSTYNIEQWNSSYLHSHINHIPKDNLEVFQRPCLGNGPIIRTISSLKEGISEGFDETKWMLFCEELSRYVAVESLTGGPYQRLESVTHGTPLSGYNGFTYDHRRTLNAIYQFEQILTKDALQDFIRYYRSKGHLAINFQQGNYKIGMSYYEYIIDISNTFIEWFNVSYTDERLAQSMYNHYIINHAVVASGKFYKVSYDIGSDYAGLNDYIGRKVCTFKGRDVCLKILTDNGASVQDTTVLNHSLAMLILHNILRTINYHYANEHNRQSQHRSDSCNPATTLPATTSQRICYI